MKDTAIAAVVGPVAEQCGLEVDRVEVAAAGKRSVLRVYLDGDGPLGRGPSLDEIAEATRAISAALDASDVTGEAPYTLEVSSRGVTRPLTEVRHFRRNIGRLVTLSLADGRVTGRIARVTDDTVTLEIDGTEETVAHRDITRAVVQVELRKDAAADAGDDAPDDEEE